MSSIRPMLFVVMPFGKKTDPTGTYEVDFDRVYQIAIKPSAEAADLEVLRADEERSGGIIHVPMFERLLLAEIVIADLTLLNANVFYELGVRHCARPRTTILIYAKENQLPFDVHMIRAIPYILNNGFLTKDSAAKLKDEIDQMLKDAKLDLERTDSPLFQLISSFPGIELPHEVTESFRDRARYIDGIRNRLREARRISDKDKSVELIKEIEESLGDFNSTHSEVLVDVLLSYRDVEAFSEMISVIARFPQPISSAITIREQYAFALNRRNGPGDRQKAIDVLLEVTREHGYSPETCGLLGRVYKDSWEDAVSQGQLEKASAYLDEAIQWYLRGFESDPRDYYPGINLVTLLFIRGDEESLKELRVLIPTVSFAVARRGGIQSQDYWDVATVLEIAVLGEDWEHAKRAAVRVSILGAPSWNIKTTLRNLRLIEKARLDRGLSNQSLDEVIKLLKACVENAGS